MTPPAICLAYLALGGHDPSAANELRRELDRRYPAPPQPYVPGYANQALDVLRSVIIADGLSTVRLAGGGGPFDALEISTVDPFGGPTTFSASLYFRVLAPNWLRFSVIETTCRGDTSFRVTIADGESMIPASPTVRDGAENMIWFAVEGACKNLALMFRAAIATSLAEADHVTARLGDVMLLLRRIRLYKKINGRDVLLGDAMDRKIAGDQEGAP